MSDTLPAGPARSVLTPSPDLQPAAFFAPTPKAAQRVLEFFTAQINNDHTRRAYLNATRRFAHWCAVRGLTEFTGVQPFHVAAFINDLQAHCSPPTVKQHLAAHAVRLADDRPCLGREPGPRRAWPKYVVRKGKTPVLTAAVVSHMQRSWQGALGVSPLEHGLRALLLLLRIYVLDVDAGGANEQEAKDRLRTAILRDPSQTDVAWARLIECYAQLAAERSGVDRPGLQHVLLSAGIDLQAPQSYREDIECLRAHTRRTARPLSQLARIRIGTAEIKIDRPSTNALRHAAEAAALLVIGEPGTGKSGALHDLTNTLIAEGRDVVVLALDHFAARSLGELRGELGLERDLTDVLAHWLAPHPL